MANRYTGDAGKEMEVSGHSQESDGVIGLMDDSSNESCPPELQNPGVGQSPTGRDAEHLADPAEHTPPVLERFDLVESPGEPVIDIKPVSQMTSDDEDDQLVMDCLGDITVNPEQAGNNNTEKTLEASDDCVVVDSYVKKQRTSAPAPVQGTAVTGCVKERIKQEPSEATTKEQGASARPAQTILLDCSYTSGSYVCHLCSYKSKLSRVFCMHLYSHIHVCSYVASSQDYVFQGTHTLCPRCASEKSYDIMSNHTDCHYVTNTMKRLMVIKSKLDAQADDNIPRRVVVFTGLSVSQITREESLKRSGFLRRVEKATPSEKATPPSSVRAIRPKSADKTKMISVLRTPSTQGPKSLLPTLRPALTIPSNAMILATNAPSRQGQGRSLFQIAQAGVNPSGQPLTLPTKAIRLAPMPKKHSPTPARQINADMMADFTLYLYCFVYDDNRDKDMFLFTFNDDIIRCVHCGLTFTKRNEALLHLYYDIHSKSQQCTHKCSQYKTSSCHIIHHLKTFINLWLSDPNAHIKDNSRCTKYCFTHKMTKRDMDKKKIYMNINITPGCSTLNTRNIYVKCAVESEGAATINLSVSTDGGVYSCLQCNFMTRKSYCLLRHLAVECHPKKHCFHVQKTSISNPTEKCPIIADIFNILYFTSPEKDLSSMADVMKEIKHLKVRSYEKSEQMYIFDLISDSVYVPASVPEPANSGGYSVMYDSNMVEESAPTASANETTAGPSSLTSDVVLEVSDDDEVSGGVPSAKPEEPFNSVMDMIEGLNQAQEAISSQMCNVVDAPEILKAVDKGADCSGMAKETNTELRNGDAADASKKADVVVVNGHEKTNGINPANANKITEVTHKVVANENRTQKLADVDSGGDKENPTTDDSPKVSKAEESSSNNATDVHEASTAEQDEDLSVLSPNEQSKAIQNVMNITSGDSDGPDDGSNGADVVEEDGEVGGAVDDGEDDQHAEDDEDEGIVVLVDTDKQSDGAMEIDVRDDLVIGVQVQSEGDSQDDGPEVDSQEEDMHDEQEPDAEPILHNLEIRTSIDEDHQGSQGWTADCSEMTDVVVEPIDESEHLGDDSGQLVIDLQDLTASSISKPRFNCFLCCFKTYNKSKVLPHVLVHSVVKDKPSAALRCPKCPYGTDNLDQYKCHLMCHDARKSVRLFRCEHCTLITDNCDSLDEHLLTTHEDQAYRLIGTRLSHQAGWCFWCETKCSVQNLSSHISRSHPSVHKMLVTEGALPNDHQSTPPTRGESILTTTVTPSLQKSDTSQLRKLLTSKAAAALQSTSADATSEGPVRQDQRLSGAVKHDQGVPGGRFSCPYCQFAHNAEATWVQHLHQHIGSGSEKFQVYKCKTCYWTSTSQKKIIIHNMVIHQQAEGVVLSEYIEIGKKSVAPQNQPTKYSCTECDFSCNNAAKFKGHMTGGVHDVKLPSRQSVVTLRHNEAEGEVKYSHTTVSEHNNRKHYCCDTCDYKTVKESHMRQHVNVHARCREAEKYYRCSHCKYEALYQFSITRHSEKFHPNEVAGVILVDRDGGETPFPMVAVNDGKDASSQKSQTTPQKNPRSLLLGSLQKTPPSSSSASPVLDEWVMPYIYKLPDGFLKCKICGYSQDGLSAVKRHIFSIHLKYKPYKCKYCEYAAVEPNKTEKHLMNMHPELEPRIVRLRFKGTLPEMPQSLPKTIYTYPAPATEAALPPMSVQEPADVKPVFAEDWKPGDPFPGHSSDDFESIDHSTPTTSFPNLTEASDDVAAEAMKIYDKLVTNQKALPVKTHRILPSPKAQGEQKRIFQCVYCGYSSKWGMKDVKMHIFSTHQKKYPFMCKYCSYGSRHQHLVKTHTSKSHPKKFGHIRHMMAEYERSFVNKVIGHVTYVATSADDLPIEWSNSTIKIRDFSHKSIRSLDTSSKGIRSPEAGSKTIRAPESATRTVQSPTKTRPPPLLVRAPMAPQKMDNNQDGMEENDDDDDDDDEIEDGNDDLGMEVKDEDDDDDIEEEDMDSSSGLRTYLPNSRMADYIWRCKDCGYTKKAKVKVRYHILGRHLHLRPYKCGYCTFSHHTRWAVEDHLKVSHIGQPHNIHELIRENTERIKKFLRKVKLNGRNPNQLETMGTGGPGSVALPHKGNVVPSFTPPKVVTPLHTPSQMNSSQMNSTPNSVGHGIYKGIDGQYCCDFCSYSSVARTLVSKHRKTHFSYRPYGCSYCRFQAFCRTRIQTHCRKVHPGKPFKVEVFEKPEKMTLSVLDKRLDRSLFSDQELATGGALELDQSEDLDNETSYSCYDCDALFDSMESLEHHKQLSHPTNERCQCYYCDVIMSDVRSMREHLVENHQDDEALYVDLNTGQTFDATSNIQGIDNLRTVDTPGDVSGPLLQDSDDGRGVDESAVPRLTCLHCQFTTTQQQSMRHHVMAHIKYKPFRCPHCPLTYVKSFPIKKHIQSMHPTEDSNHVLHEKDLKIEESLKNHYVVGKVSGNHSKDSRPILNDQHSRTSSPAPRDSVTPTKKPDVQSGYRCPLCGHTTSQTISIRRHLMAELNYKPWTCPQSGCDYRDVQAGGIKRHCLIRHKIKDSQGDHRKEEDKEAMITRLIGEAKLNKGDLNNISLPMADVGSDDRSMAADSDDLDENESPLTAKVKLHSIRKTKRSSYESDDEPQAKQMKVEVTSDDSSDEDVIEVPETSSPVQCKLCNLTVHNKKALHTHMVRHGPKRYQCLYCDYSVFFPFEITKHCLSRHGKSPKYRRLAGAPVKSFRTKDPNLVEDGSENEGSGKEGSGKEESEKEESGKEESVDSEDLEESYEVQQKMEKISEMKENAVNDRISNAEAKKLYNKAPITATEMENPDDEHDDEIYLPPIDGLLLPRTLVSQNFKGHYRCRHCDFLSPKIGNFKEHLVRHTLPRFKCAHCHYKCQLTYDMRRHQRNSHPQKPREFERIKPVSRKKSESPTTVDGADKSVHNSPSREVNMIDD